MPFQLFTYNRVEDLKSELIKAPAAAHRIFLVAASGDREIIASLLSGVQYEYRVRRWDEIYRLFASELAVAHPRVQLDPPDHWLLLRGIVARYLESGGKLPAGATRHGFLSLLGDQIRELISEEVPPEELEAVYDADDKEGHAFADLYRMYLESLEKNHLSDSAGVTSAASELLGISGAGEICRNLDITLVGFSSLTHSQLRLIRGLVSLGAFVRVFTPLSGLVDSYGAVQQFGDNEFPLYSGRPFPVLKLTAGDRRQEAETAVRLLCLWEQGRGRLSEYADWCGWENIAFSVPAARLSEFREVLKRYNVPFYTPFRVKISETPLWQLANFCLDAASGGWQTRPVLRMLGEPWLCGSSLRVDYLLGLHPRGTKGWRRVLEKLPAAAAAFEACFDFSEAIRRGGTALELLEALRFFAGDRARIAASRVKDDSSLDCDIALFGEALNELDRKILFVREVVRDLGEFGEDKLKGADARAYLAAWAEGTTAAQSGIAGGAMTLFADTPPTLFTSPVWFFFGAEAGSWPGGQKESPLLSELCKERLHDNGELGLDRTHLPLMSEVREQREFLFRRMIASGSELTVVARSMVDAEQRPQNETPLLEHAFADGWAEEVGVVERTLGNLLLERDEDSLIPVEIYKPDFSIENSLPDDRVRPGFLEIDKNHVGLSAVDDYAACPYFFALRDLMKYREAPREQEYDQLKGGTAVHAVWEKVWNEYAAGGFKASISMLTSVHFSPVISEIYPQLLEFSSLRRVLEKIKYEVDRMAVMQDEFETALRSRRDKVLTELELPPIEFGGVSFMGQCDRLDLMNDGTYLLWDYKAGNSYNYKNALQLACYALALDDTDIVRDRTVAGWGFLCMKDCALTGRWNDEYSAYFDRRGSKKITVASETERAVKVLSDIAASITTSRFDPNYSSGSCRYCSFSGMCRKGEFIDFDEDYEEQEEVLNDE